MGSAVHRGGGAGAARRQTDVWRARDLAPGRSQHGTRHLLFHEDEAHVTLARRLHQLDRFAARMPDDKGGSRLLERSGHPLHSRRHQQSSAIMRSEEHTSELQSLMRLSYAVLCLKKKTHNLNHKDKPTNMKTVT